MPLAATLILALLFAACGDGYNAASKTSTAAAGAGCVSPTACASRTSAARPMTSASMRATATPATMPGGLAGTAIAGSVGPGATTIGIDDITPSIQTPTPFYPSATVPPSVPADTPTADASGATGIAGIVTLGPTCPVQRIDSPCPDRPYEARLTLHRGGDTIAETRSTADGRFRFDVPAGAYVLIGESAVMLPRGSQQDVLVVAGAVTSVVVTYDTGIR